MFRVIGKSYGGKSYSLKGRKALWKFNPAWLVLTLQAVGLGCGPVFTPAPANSTPLAQSTPSPELMTVLTAPSYRCSGRDNAWPINLENQALNGGSFEVCPSMNQDNMSDILIKGQALVGNTICVYPAASSGSGKVNVLLDRFGKPMVECIAMKAGMALFSFSPALGKIDGFNTVYITSDINGVLSYCLATHFTDATVCARENLVYSFGVFR